MCVYLDIWESKGEVKRVGEASTRGGSEGGFKSVVGEKNPLQ